MPKTYHAPELRRSEMTGPVESTARRALVAALDVIEAELPPDAEVRLETARRVAHLLCRGLLSRLEI